MKDVVSYLLNINIPVQNNTFKKRLFDFIVLTIDYYWPTQPPTQIKLIFLWLDKLSPLISPLINSNHTENESHRNNCSMGKEDNQMS